MRFVISVFVLPTTSVPAPESTAILLASISCGFNPRDAIDVRRYGLSRWLARLPSIKKGPHAAGFLGCVDWVIKRQGFPSSTLRCLLVSLA